MITVSISDNFLPEKKYIIDILFNEFLGLKYEIKISKIRDYQIILENGNTLVIRDLFFSRFRNGLDYLHEINIPQKVKFLKNQFIVESEIPVIFGNEELKVTPNEIICGIELFASSFFMLSRWEEYVNKTRDIHNRFPAFASLAYKNDFINRPVVNEYIEMLWSMLLYLGNRQKRKERKFRLIVTHDVDEALDMAIRFPYYLGRHIVHYVKKNKLNLIPKELINWLSPEIGRGRDLSGNYDWIMTQSEKLGLKSAFYFKATSETGKFDSSYNPGHPLLKSVIENILRRGHEIGFHPGYYTADNREKWFEEWHNFKRFFSDIDIKGGRQHYLRFYVPLTWRFWEDAGLKYDSTLSYADHAGFRSGVCYEYPVFDFIRRKRLKIKERPLLFMEKSLLKQNYMNFSKEQFEEYVSKLKRTVRRYNGDLTFLWHINNLTEKYLKKLYLRCINEDCIYF